MKTQSHNGRQRFSETLWRTFICYLRVTLIKDSNNAPQRRRIIFVAEQWPLESMKTPVFSVLKPLSLFQIENHVSDIDNWNQVRTWISLKIKRAIQQKCQWFLHVLVSSHLKCLSKHHLILFNGFLSHSLCDSWKTTSTEGYLMLISTEGLGQKHSNGPELPRNGIHLIELSEMENE